MLHIEAAGFKGGIYMVSFGKFRIGYIYPMGYFEPGILTLQYDPPYQILKGFNGTKSPETLTLNVADMDEAKRFFEEKSWGMTLENAY